MNRQQVKDILEAIGFLAIIASLYFVGVETQDSAKQTALNTQAVQIAAYQELITSIASMNAISIEGKDAAAILVEMRGGDSDGVDDYQLLSAFFMYFRHGDMAFFMFEKGIIDEDRLRSTLRPLPLSGETGIEFWNRNKFVFVNRYQLYIDTLIEEGFWIGIQ